MIAAHHNENEEFIKELRWEVVIHALYFSRSLAYEQLSIGFNEGKEAARISSSVFEAIPSRNIYAMFEKKLQKLVQYSGEHLAARITFEFDHHRLPEEYLQLCMGIIGRLATKEAHQTAKAWTGSAMVNTCCPIRYIIVC